MYLQYFKDLDREGWLAVIIAAIFFAFLGWLWITWYDK